MITSVSYYRRIKILLDVSKAFVKRYDTKGRTPYYLILGAFNDI